MEDNQEYKNLEGFLNHQLTELMLKEVYDKVNSTITKNRKVSKKYIYIIYEGLCDYAHIYERNENIDKEEQKVMHSHEPTYENFHEPNALFNLVCGLYIVFLLISIQLLHNKGEINDEELETISEQFTV